MWIRACGEDCRGQIGAELEAAHAVGARVATEPVRILMADSSSCRKSSPRPATELTGLGGAKWSTALRQVGLNDAEVCRTAPRQAADSLFFVGQRVALTVLGVKGSEARTPAQLYPRTWGPFASIAAGQARVWRLASILG
jgi:hypothetical protein